MVPPIAPVPTTVNCTGTLPRRPPRKQYAAASQFACVRRDAWIRPFDVDVGAAGPTPPMKERPPSGNGVALHVVRGRVEDLVRAQPARVCSCCKSKRAVIRWELGQVKSMPLAQRSLALLEDLRSRLLKRYGEKRAQEWLRQPNRGLRGNPPIDVLVASGLTPVRDIVT